MGLLGLERGWELYEWRLRVAGYHQARILLPRFDQLMWEGQDLSGKRILLDSEQGFGDTIQFVRYAPCVKNLGATVVVESQKALVRLLESCPGIDQLIGYGDGLPHFDCQVPMMSLPPW